MIVVPKLVKMVIIPDSRLLIHPYVVKDMELLLLQNHWIDFADILHMVHSYIKQINHPVSIETRS